MTRSKIWAAAYKIVKNALFTGRLPGFALIEIAFVLIILGIIGSFGMPMFRLMKNQARHKETTMHEALVVESLKAFITANHRLPCPATNNRNKGAEHTKCYNNPNLCVGIVPYKTLGLSEEQAKDGFGHWFTYGVAGQLTVFHASLEAAPAAAQGESFAQPNYHNQSLCYANGGDLKVVSFDGESVYHPPAPPSPQVPRDFIGFVLVSHGAAGTGAYKKQSMDRGLEGLSHLEQENADGNLTFVTGPAHMKGSNLFRHHLTWVTKNNLMASVGVHCRKKSIPSEDVGPSGQGSDASRRGGANNRASLANSLANSPPPFGESF